MTPIQSRDFGDGQKGQIGQTNYSAAKAGMIGLSKAPAQDNAKKGITVNTIAPATSTPKWSARRRRRCWTRSSPPSPLAAWGMADEIARCVAFLAAEDAGFITGATLPVNGGQYIGG